MQDALNKIREFQRKHKFKMGVNLLDRTGVDSDLDRALTDFSSLLTDISEYLESRSGEDPRVLRAHLIAEETAEIFAALSKRDEVELLDALADSIYVVAGTATTFDLPLAEGFDAVHASNMLKAVRGQEDVRLRNKGEHWKAPDLAKVLSDYRTARA